MSIKVPKTGIPHPKHANGDPTKFAEHGAHVGMLLASGHYVPGTHTDDDQHIEPNGTVVTTLRLVPTNINDHPGPAPT